ncbi:MAG: succinylglutamate desuccinylase/aspartoacylase family protein [Candidatus Marinimicrobia bacterium]|nr:succinylglutamate desuccinylase/aspartoacylase family protein [Candidatus Neomarinimicrobiota bacterium]
MSFLKKHLTRLLILASALSVSAFVGIDFLSMHVPDPIYPNPCQKLQLSDYFKPLAGTAGDTDVYIFEGDQAGATVLILGGTHANEPAGHIAAVSLMENIEVDAGRLIILPRANNSGFTHNDPQEGNPQRFMIKTRRGERWFRYGSRYTNSIDQWPDPDVYEHQPSGQHLSGSETRNLNRSYPGSPDGNLTEKIGYAIMQLLKQEHVDLAFDLHEASLEYPVINAVVAHQLAFDLAAEVVMTLQMEDILFNLEPSPVDFHGLSHREWGDALGIPVILMESANPLQGRYHGKVTPDIIVTGKDKYNLQAAKSGLIEVNYPADGIPLNLRVARHLSGLATTFDIWNSSHQDDQIIVKNIPSYSEMITNGLGVYLK